MFSLTDMAGVAEPADAKVKVRFRVMVWGGVHRSWLEGGQGEVRGTCD